MSVSHRQERSSVEAFWAFTDRQWTRSDLTLAEGSTLAKRMLASSLVPEAVLCLATHETEFVALAAGRCPVTVLTPAEMDQWAGFAFHRGVVAVARRPEPLSLESFLSKTPAPRRLAVAPRLTDPENLGSVFRSALALGWDAVAVGAETCDPFSRRTAKVSMGAVYAHPPVILPSDATVTRRLFEAAGWTNLALTLEPEAVDLEAWVGSEPGKAALSGRLAAWVGNEFEGLAPGDRSVCDQALVVPMAEGHDSLNAAVAAGIAFYRLRASFG
jgi:tRNA G18 (ribose-2'-O)-methylase SpoU